MRGKNELAGWIRRGTYIKDKNVPFQELLPLKLKPAISGKSSKGSNVACIQEMSVMFACLKKNDFTEHFCPKEIASFNKCVDDNAKMEVVKLEKDRQGILTPGEKDLSPKQINELLKKFPS